MNIEKLVKRINLLENKAHLKLEKEEFQKFFDEFKIFEIWLKKFDNFYIDAETKIADFPFLNYYSDYLRADEIIDEPEKNKIKKQFLSYSKYFKDDYFILNLKNDKTSEINLTKINKIKKKSNSKMNDMEGSTLEKIFFIEDPKITKNSNSILFNKTFSIKDNFATKGIKSTSGSLLLENFIPNYNATVYEKLISEGAIPLYKANLDELAMGSTGLTSAFKEVSNPFSDNHIIGGSSSGSAYLLSKNYVDFSIGSDTGDSIRKPAALTNVVGFKPTWGIVSRLGLYDFAPSWDTVGWLTKTVDLSAKLLDVLQGYDSGDASSIFPKELNFFKDLNRIEKKDIVLSVPKNLIKYIPEPIIRKKFRKFISKLKNDGFKIKNFDFDKYLLKMSSYMYWVISIVDSFSSNSNLTGFLFGEFFDSTGSYAKDITEVRSNFNYEVKKRFLFANEIFLNNNHLYEKAKQIRFLLIEKFENLFKKNDIILFPANFEFAFRKSEIFKKNWHNLKKNIIDDYLSLFNAIGAPSISIPYFKSEEKTMGISISAKPFNDKKCLQVAKLLENYKEEF